MAIKTRKLIVVIGMHRTGTSLITRGLQVLGVNLGDNLLPAMAEVNAKGFWEDADINALNIEMLHALGSDWDFLKPIAAPDIQLLNIKGYLLKAVELLRTKVSQVSIFGLKDPRIAILLPFWDQVFEHCGYQVDYLLTIRNPLSVVRSLQKRDGFFAEKAYLLWFTHVVAALDFSRKKSVSVVDYDFFMQNSVSELERLAANFALRVNYDELDIYLNDFLDNSLRHTQFELNDLALDSACPAIVRDIYTRLLGVAHGTMELNSPEITKDIQSWLHTLLSFNVPFKVIDSLNGSVSENKKTIFQHEQTIQNKDSLIENLEKFNAERIHQVQTLYAETQKRDEHIQTLNNDFSQASDQLQKAYQHINELSQDIDNLKQNIINRDQAIDACNVTIKEKEHHANDIWLQLQAEIAEKNALLSSRSWRITMPFRFVARLIKHGLSPQDKHQIFIGVQRFHHKSPRFIQQINRKFYHLILRPLLGSARNNAALVATADVDANRQNNYLPTITISPSSGTDYVMWGVIDWHFRHQRPQQIAQALAGEGDRVFYISSNLVDAPTAGFVIEPLDDSGRLFQVKLSVDAAMVIYDHAPSAKIIKNLLASIAELLLWAKTERIINIVQHPFWYPIALQLPNSQLVYDCMDHHEGFENTGKEIAALEHQLFHRADLTITTSEWLDDIVSKQTPRRTLIRNAGEYEHFSTPPKSVYRDVQNRKIIGYYGAIAEWFDVALIEKLANHFKDCCILLVGADTVNLKSQLKHCSNIVFTGEVPYKELTHYLYVFDVCLLPFKVIPLTLATNPVKVYEYLGAGKPVVAVDLPEIKQFGSLVKAASNHNQFIQHVSDILNTNDSAENIAARKAFAQQQTWHHRAKAIATAVQSLQPQPKVSVIVVTYNNLDLTKVCLSSLEKYTHYPNMEVIVVDNASSDGSPDYLREWAQQGSNRVLILNPDNKGFAAGNNQGLLVATGDYLVLLNNDTHVTPGWLGSLVKHMELNTEIGLLGPVTNNIGNEAKISISYNSMDEMLTESRRFTLHHIGQLTPLRTAAFFCVMISRAAYEKVGLLDEVFGIGFFEDDDYCRRIEQAGMKIYCADDVFIHHHLSASFNKLKIEVRQKLFEQNKVTYEAKWGEWIPHKYRSGVTH